MVKISYTLQQQNINKLKNKTKQKTHKKPTTQTTTKKNQTIPKLIIQTKFSGFDWAKLITILLNF